MSSDSSIPAAAATDEVSEESRPNSTFIEALARGLSVIQAFTAESPEMTLTEVAAKTGLSPATARRCLLTLKELGYVGSVGRRFLLRSKVLSLGSAFLNSMNLRDVAEPHLQDLAAAFHDSASLAVLEDADIVYVAHMASQREQRYAVRIGSRRPAYATSLGLAILAFQDAAAQERMLSRAPFQRYTPSTVSTASELEAAMQRAAGVGYALVQDQLEYGALAVAVPIRDARGRVVASINCSSDRSRVDAEALVKTRVPLLSVAARNIEEALARSPALVHSVFAN